jgi:fructose-1,6-bisphosphatase/inositol monophosphatase family enzyme
MNFKTLDLSFLEPLNDYNISVLMREAARRACRIIKGQRVSFTVEEKVSSNKPNQIDYVTSSDTDSQKMYTDFLKRNFPKFGIIGEEDGLFTPAQPFIECRDIKPSIEHFFYFTIDPLDGTKAYKRIQSDGYSTMLALIHHCPERNYKEVVAVCIADPMTDEIYFTRIGSAQVHLIEIESDKIHILLPSEPNCEPKEMYVSLRDNPRSYSPIARALGDAEDASQNFFKNIEIQGGSIGISYAKLWKGQYGGLLLKEGIVTVWDCAPVIGICKKLGYVPLVVENGAFVQSEFLISVERADLPQPETLIVHESLVPAILEWQKQFLAAPVSA